MPECGNCGGYITRAYARVFAPRGADSPRHCPACRSKGRVG